MRLISLTANKLSFKTVTFNETGPTYILAKQKNPDETDSGRTYNGVGKSLLIALLHFCLGSNKNKNFEQALPDWEFTLRFKLQDEEFSVSRATSAQDKFSVNGKEMKLKAYKEMLEARTFIVPSGSDLSYRNLVSRFLRPRKDSYVYFDTPISDETPYTCLLHTGFLLGLEPAIISEKHRLKVERDRIKEFSGNLEKDSVFKEFFTQGKNIDIELKDLEEEIVKLERDLENFKVAENYHDVEAESVENRRALQEARNRDVVLQNAIENINVSLQQQPDIALTSVTKVYEEAKANLPESVIKSLSEVTEFHQKLMANRVKRLTSERAQLEKEKRELQEVIRDLGAKVDAQFAFLGAHGALEEFVILSNKVSDLKAKAQKIRDYKALLEKYKAQLSELSIALESETKKAATYLKEAKPLTEGNLELFRSFSRQFYPDKPGGLVVSNNEGDNQTRFNIEAHIQDDASDGINEVKIFCFDMTLLKAGHNHSVAFVMHDSRLFSDIDPRQRAIAFRISHELTKSSGLQYIATVNQDQIEAIREHFSPQEFTEMIEQRVRLELTDDSPTSKLLGVQVDMQY